MILAELSLVILYLLDSGALAQIIIQGIFVGISMKSEHANEQNKLKSNQFQEGKINYENMPVTKVIVKDLLKGTYREIYHKPRNWEPKQEDEPKPEKMPKAIIIGIGAILTLLSTFIVLKIGFSFYEKEDALVSEQNNEQQPVSMISIQQPAVPAKNWNQYSYSKTSKKPELTRLAEEKRYRLRGSNKKFYVYEKNGIVHLVDSPSKINLSDRTKRKFSQIEEVIGYKVFMKNGSEISCKNIIKLRSGILTMIDEKIRIDVPVDEVKDLEKYTKVANERKVSVIQPDSF